MTRRLTVTVEVPQPLAAMLETEAAASERTLAQHLLHVLGTRYLNLIRICRCGYFIYYPSDDLACDTCGVACCPFDSIPQDYRTLCFTCAEGQGIDTVGKGGFRAAPEGKV